MCCIEWWHFQWPQWPLTPVSRSRCFLKSCVLSAIAEFLVNFIIILFISFIISIVYALQLFWLLLAQFAMHLYILYQERIITTTIIITFIRHTVSVSETESELALSMMEMWRDRCMYSAKYSSLPCVELREGQGLKETVAVIWCRRLR